MLTILYAEEKSQCQYIISCWISIAHKCSVTGAELWVSRVRSATHELRLQEDIVVHEGQRIEDVKSVVAGYDEKIANKSVETLIQLRLCFCVIRCGIVGGAAWREDDVGCVVVHVRRVQNIVLWMLHDSRWERVE